MKKEGKDGRQQVAAILRRLTIVAKEVDLPMAEKASHIVTARMFMDQPLVLKTRENIDKYCEKFEKDMLYLFDRCYRKGDPKMMHVCLTINPPYCNFLTLLQHCAQTLLDFNGGASCVQIYVNQHDFFFNKSKYVTNENDEMSDYFCPIILNL